MHQLSVLTNKVKAKVKLPLCLTKYQVMKTYTCLIKHHEIKTYWGMEVYLHTFLNT